MITVSKTSFVLAPSLLLVLGLSNRAHSQGVTNNSSSLTNSAAPSASSVTSGGTNINYQTNNQWSNEVGFGPGIFCRTPTFYAGGSGGTTYNNVDNENFGGSGNYGQNYTGNIGILVPFGSSILRDCQRLSAQIVRDRQISTELSMIRACASLKKEGIKVDPQKYPLLALCASDNQPSNTLDTQVQPSLSPMPNPSSSPSVTKPVPEALHNPNIKKTTQKVSVPTS